MYGGTVIMSWLPSFFKGNKSQNSQQSLNNLEEKNSTTVIQILVEETIMAAAQWLITFVNRTIQSKQVSQVKEQASTVAHTVPLEELLSKFGSLVEQLYEREQGITPLHNRISEIEAFLKQSGNFEQHMQTSSQHIAALEERLMQIENQIKRIDMSAIEAFLQKAPDLEQYAEESTQSIAALVNRLADIEDIEKQVSSSTEKLDQTNQNIRTLEQRISHLEKLLTRFSIIPKLVEGNHRAVISLQSQLETLKNAPKNSLRVVSK